MVVETLLGYPFPLEKSADFALEHGARVPGGTDMGVLSRALFWAFGLKVAETDGIDVLRVALEQGCVAVVNVGGDRTGHKGVFSDSTFGLEAGMQLTCQPMGGYGAGCTESARYYRQKGRFVTSGPQPGDQIFFTRDGGGTMYHTGLVEKVAGGRVYTIEGNTSSAAGVVENGGAVRDKSYPLTYAQIGGYGRPDWSLVQGDDEMTEQQIREIIRDELQKAALTRGSLKANAWAAQYIKACIEAGAMTDVGGGTIERPQDFATREELAKVAAVMAQR